MCGMIVISKMLVRIGMSMRSGVRGFAARSYYFEKQVTVMPNFNTKISELPLRVKIKKLRFPVRLKHLP